MVSFFKIAAALLAFASTEVSGQDDGPAEMLRGSAGVARYESGTCNYANMIDTCGGFVIQWSNSSTITFQEYCTYTACYLFCSTVFAACRIDDCMDNIMSTLTSLGATGTGDVQGCYSSLCCDCFSEESTVDVEGQSEPVLMKDLEVGDKVLTGNNKYEPVYAFAHKEVDGVGSYLSISTSKDGHNIEISKDHLIYLKGHDNPLRAREVKVGDEVLVKDGESAVVTDIKLISKPGLYNPLTKDGTIMVNGIKASNYVGLHDIAPMYVEMLEAIGISHHMIGHLWFSPLRVVCMAVSDKTCEGFTEGFHSWAGFGKNVVATTDAIHWFLRPFAMAAVVAFLAMSLAVEFVINQPAIVIAIVMAMKFGPKFSPKKVKALSQE